MATGMKIMEVEAPLLSEDREINLSIWDPHTPGSFISFYKDARIEIHNTKQLVKDGREIYSRTGANFIKVRHFEIVFSLIGYSHQEKVLLHTSLKRVSIPIVHCVFHPIVEGLLFYINWQSNKIYAVSMPRYTPGLSGFDVAEQVVDVGTHDVMITCLAISTSGTLISTGDCKGVVKVWMTKVTQSDFASDEAVSLRILNILTSHNGPVNDLKFLNEESIVTCGSDNAVRVWNLTNKSLAHTLVTDSAAMNVLSFLEIHNSLNGRENEQENIEGVEDQYSFIIGGNDNGCMYIWNSISSSLSALQDYSKLSITCIDTSPYSNIIAYGSRDNILRICIWDENSHKHILEKEINLHSEIVSVSISENKTILAATMFNGVHLFDASNDKDINTISQAPLITEEEEVEEEEENVVEEEEEKVEESPSILAEEELEEDNDEEEYANDNKKEVMGSVSDEEMATPFPIPFPKNVKISSNKTASDTEAEPLPDPVPHAVRSFVASKQQQEKSLQNTNRKHHKVALSGQPEILLNSKWSNPNRMKYFSAKINNVYSHQSTGLNGAVLASSALLSEKINKIEAIEFPSLSEPLTEEDVLKLHAEVQYKNLKPIHCEAIKRRKVNKQVDDKWKAKLAFKPNLESLLLPSMQAVYVSDTSNYVEIDKNIILMDKDSSKNLYNRNRLYGYV